MLVGIEADVLMSSRAMPSDSMSALSQAEASTGPSAEPAISPSAGPSSPGSSAEGDQYDC